MSLQSAFAFAKLATLTSLVIKIIEILTLRSFEFVMGKRDQSMEYNAAE